MICIAPIITADTPSPAANIPAAYQPSPLMKGMTAVARARVAVPTRTWADSGQPPGRAPR